MGTRIGFGRGNYGQLPGANNDIEALSALIVHETCHFHQGHTRKKFGIHHRDDKPRGIREQECDTKEETFLEALHTGMQAKHTSEYGIYEDIISSE